MPTPLDIAKAFAESAGALTGIKTAQHFMPEELPSLPAVLLLPRRVQQLENETGPHTQNLWTWAVYLVLPLGGRVAGSDFQAAQELLYVLLPRVLGVVRHNPELTSVAFPGGTCQKAWLADLDEEPDFDAEAGTLSKTLELTARTEET